MAHMKTGTKIIRIVCWGLGGAMILAGVLRLPGGLEGVYDQRQEIVVPGDPEPDTDANVATEMVNTRLTLSHDTGRSIAFHAELVGAYYHTCDLDGVAEMRPRNPLGGTTVFRFTEVPDGMETNEPCVLDIRVTSTEIQLEVVGDTQPCGYYCGARASLDSGYFERKNRSPLAD